MRWWTYLGVGWGLLLAVAATPAAPVERQVMVAALQADYPGVQIYNEGSQVSRVYGTAFSFGDSPEQSAAAFVQNYAALYGVDADQLAPGNDFNNVLAQPLGYDAETDTYRFTLVYYMQFQDGVPVYRSNLRLLVRNVDGYPLVLAGATLKDLGSFSVPTMAAAADAGAQGHQAALALVPDLMNFSPSRYVVWAGLDEPVAPRLAVEFVADNDLPATGQYAKWLFVADAHTGEILYQENQIVNVDVTGSVHGNATTPPKADICNPEVDTIMEYAKVSIGSTVRYADVNGNFVIPNGGSSPVTVSSYIAGQYFVVQNQAGANTVLTLSVTPPGPANFLHNASNTSEFNRAEVNGYVQANVGRDFTLANNPSYPTISTQTNFTVNVNINDSCNAYYDGSSINFYRSGGGCPNTAYSNVVHHEYGHHLVQSGGSGQDAYGEGMGDCIAMLIADDPILGYGFEGNCNAGIRDADNTFQYPCSGEIHYCGQLLSGCVWSTRTALLAAYPSTYRQIISYLTVNSILLHDGGSITPSIYIDFLTVDDDDGDISNGTPHIDQITAGFQVHNMVPGPPPANDACTAAIDACPGQAYTGNTANATNDGSANCGTSNSSPDVWYRYVPASNGSLTASLCGSGTNYDSVMSIHSGCPGTSSNQLGCDDDACSGAGGPSRVTINVTAGHTYMIRVTGWSGASGSYSLTLTGPACGTADTTPPTPNPMTFATPPTPAGPTSINMVATTATDSQSPPVQYQFEFVSGGSGGTSSSWQSGTQYTDTGLAPNTGYTYHVRARDNASTPNMTQFSDNASTNTLANVPAAPTLNAAGATTLNVDVNANGNPAYTLFAISCTGTNPPDTNWLNQYVDASGDPSATAVWQTDAQWGAITVNGLHPSTAYTFAVKAENVDNVETAFGPGATLSTINLVGDMNCDGVVNNFDITPFVLALTDPSGYATQYPGCPITNGDINGDGQVNNFDITPFVLLLGG